MTSLTEALRQNHILTRIPLCHWALEMIRDDPHFFKYVLFSDEAKFYCDGQLNRNNFHNW